MTTCLIRESLLSHRRLLAPALPRISGYPTGTKSEKISWASKLWCRYRFIVVLRWCKQVHKLDKPDKKYRRLIWRWFWGRFARRRRDLSRLNSFRVRTRKVQLPLSIPHFCFPCFLLRLQGCVVILKIPNMYEASRMSALSGNYIRRRYIGST